MILLIVFAYLYYKKASEANRNPILWAFLGAVIYIASQIVVGLIFGVLFEVMIIGGYSEDLLAKYGFVITASSTGISIIVSLIVLHYVSKVSAEADSGPKPPDPPTFMDGYN